MTLQPLEKYKTQLRESPFLNRLRWWALWYLLPFFSGMAYLARQLALSLARLVWSLVKRPGRLMLIVLRWLFLRVVLRLVLMLSVMLGFAYLVRLVL
ncbi:Uncharacterised protein [Pseudomonas aeruginosa]|nr:Uncharacterised protein [Pseudomonas aeruginosa]